MSRAVSGAHLMQMARMESRIASEGRPVTPVVFRRYEFFGGERGFMLGYPTQTQSGAPAIVWTHKADGAPA